MGWVEALVSGAGVAPVEVFDIDYARYGAGEATLAWLDERLVFSVPEGMGRMAVNRFLKRCWTHCIERRWLLGI